MGEIRRWISQLVYQAGGNAVVYLCQAWCTENPGGREGGGRRQLFDSDYPFLSRGGVSITTLSARQNPHRPTVVCLGVVVVVGVWVGGVCVCGVGGVV